MVRSDVIAGIRLRGTAFVVLIGMMCAEMLRIALVCLRWPGVDTGHKQRHGGEKGENDAHTPAIADGLGNSHCHSTNFFRSDGIDICRKALTRARPILPIGRRPERLPGMTSTSRKA